MVTWPLRVNPNFSKRIIGRESAVIVRDLISAVERERRERRERRRTESGRSKGIFAILAGGGESAGELL